MTFNYGLNYITYLEERCETCETYSFQLEDKLTCEIFNFDLQRLDCSQKLITYIIDIPSSTPCTEYIGRLMCGEEIIYHYHVIINCNGC